MSLFKKKEAETITFSVEDAKAMVEGKYNDTFKKTRLNFWKNVKKNAMDGRTSYGDFEYLYDHYGHYGILSGNNIGEDIVKIYRTIAAEFESFGFRVLLEERVTKKEDFENIDNYLVTRMNDKVELKIYWDKESEG